MSLEKYEKKRDFSKTDEPKPGMKKSARNALRFVVQKHEASRLHYDFRLEYAGALLSWAVPKGPSFNPRDKRLAVRVEDHPYEYKDFEGTIPKGEYGGGTVMLWDEGTWEAEGEAEDMLSRGDLKFTLHGKRLRGKWALVRMKPKPCEEDKNWLLIKEKDDLAGQDAGIETYNESVRSNRTMKEISGQLPFNDVKVALPTLRDQPPEGNEWLSEIKYDGYRIVCYKSGSEVLLKTRNGLDYTVKFPELAQSLREWNAPPCILDGETTVFKDGVSDFADLQRFIKSGSGNVRYVIFDLLYLEKDMRGLPLWERKQGLEKLLKDAPDELVFSNHIEGKASDVFRAACSSGLEGIVVKDRNSVYTGGRTEDWIKVKCGMRQEFVVLGYSIKKKELSSLLLAVNEQDGLRYVGRAGTGYSQSETEELLETFAPLKIPEPVVSVSRRAGEDYVWLKPSRVAEVSFASWTTSGLLRQASFKGLREDKVDREVVKETASINHESRKATKSQEMPLTSPGKEVYKGVTKKDVMDYYQNIAPRLLPFVQGRLASLVRCPSGVDKKCFYQKHLREDTPGLSKTEIHESDGDTAEYLAVEDEAGIFNAVQLNTIEFHVWGSRLEALEKPDTVVFDLDPDAGLELQAVRQGLRDLKGILDAIGLISFLKTSGSKGYHVVIPLNPAAEWETVRDFARRVAKAMEEKRPDRYTSNVRKVKRKGKIFIDWIRNTRGATSVVPYSLRARDVPAVSCPISWDEMNRVAPQDITIHNLFRRRKTPWAEYFNIRQELK